MVKKPSDGEQEQRIRKLEREVAERERANEALRESEERFRALAESLPETIYEIDKRGTLRFVNRQAFDHFRYTREDFEQGLHVLDMVVPEDRDRAWQNIRMTLRGKKGGTDEYTALRKDGTTFPVTVYSSPILKGGRAAGLRGFVIDMTERKKVEEQKRELEAQLQRAQKMEAVCGLASGVAHNFRNILAVISMKSQLIQMKHRDHPALQDMVQGIVAQVDRGARLVDSLMDFCRQEAKKGFQPINLVAVIQDVHERIKKTFDKTIKIRTEVPKSIHIIGDAGELKKVFLSLCDNARDAMPEGGRLEIVAEEQGERAKVIVSDTGKGMDKETVEKCFDPFFTTKPTNQGAGLGLSMAYGIVKEHEGEILVSSELRKGTTFTLSFPLTDVGKART